MNYPALSPNANPMGVHDEKYALIVALNWMGFNESEKLSHQDRNRLGVMMELDGDDALIARRRIGHDIRKIAVEGHEDGLELLSLGDDGGVKSADWKNLAQQSHFMALVAQRLRDLKWD